jgi:alkylation response protein AidB-like acyl-CoA dehydrogenase
MREARDRAYAPSVDIGLPGDDDPRRRRVRAWMGEHPHPTGRQLAEAGYVVPHWAPPYGLDADPPTQLMIDEELRRAGVRRPVNPIGIGWAGPTLMGAGTDEQKERWLWPLLSGEEFWCQLFSEPGAGSDLAALTTRAERDGDHYVVNGQKVWTSYAHMARWGILLARTDPKAAKHNGISYFVCPMDAPGIEIRPLIDMTGEHAFNEVFFTDVRIPADHLVGPEHGGWNLAKVTLGNERVSLSGEGALWGMGPTADDLVDLVKAAGGAPDPVQRDSLVSVWMESQILRVLRLRMVSAVLAGRAPGAEASVRKAIADAHGQHIMGMARDLAGPHAMLLGTGPVGGWGADGADTGVATWSRGFLFAPALTIGGGTAEVQRNIVAEKVLGLPRDP